MNEKMILRIYMPVGAKIAGPRSFWQKIFGPSLAGFLIKKAKEFGVEQAIFQKVIGGYLKKGKIAFDQSEAISPDLPQCVELIDHKDLLNKFFESYKDQFSECTVIMFQANELLANLKQKGDPNAPLA